MKDKLKTFAYIRMFVNMLAFVAGLVVGMQFGEYLTNKLLEFNVSNVYLFSILMIAFHYFLIYVLNYLNVFWHELGHLVFGLYAKYKFVSFCVLNFMIVKEKGKFKIRKKSKQLYVKGFCSMKIDVKTKSSRRNYILFMIGGGLFDLIAVLVSFALLLIIDSTYFGYLCFINMLFNLYYVLNNFTPAMTSAGTPNDMLHVVYVLDDSKYINKLDKLVKVEELLDNGTPLKDIDSKLFVIPKKINNYADFLNASLYADYKISKRQFKDVKEYINGILKDEDNILTSNQKIIFNIQLILCHFYNKCNLEEIKNLWSDEIQKYLNSMYQLTPIFIGINYMYASLVNKDEENATFYLNQFNKLNRSYYKALDIEELETFIKLVDTKRKKEKI